MRRMAALGIGVSLMCASGCVVPMEIEASGLARQSDWNTAPAVEEPTCFEIKMPGNGWTIIGYSPSGGWPLLSEIDCTEAFLPHTMLGNNAQPDE